ncbi:MAG TPA: radical SAM protein [Chitinophagales bacterium]|nr:radical SAM protein [Chitinophagales bacterium]
MAPYKVVLYNPVSVFYTMPLALLAIGSYLDPKKYEVIIIDGRLEKDPLAQVLKACEGAVCFGTSVLTGAPIKDALSITRGVKAKFPNLVTCWGGWHPSLFPDETLEEASVDVVVTGQGEITFAELLLAIEGKQSFESIKGIHYKKESKAVANAPRATVDINLFPEFNYDLIPVESYFKLKGRRQMDYISSQGCRFRCSFCADPFMYKRGWYGFTPERMGRELEALWQKYKFDDLNFQDETFFTYKDRVIGIANEIINRNLKFTWFGTMRADQGVRLGDDIYKLCKKSGLNRVMIGLEAGSQEMLDWMKKDIKIEQIFESAKKCVENGLAINFSIIVGFPGEKESSVNETLRVARELRKMSSDFALNIFYFKPYPGNDIAVGLLKEGYQFPKGLEQWAGFDYVGSTSEWINEKQYKQIESFKFYHKVGWNRGNLLSAGIQKIARWRCENHNYTLPVEKMVYEFLKPPVRLS